MATAQHTAALAGAALPLADRRLGRRRITSILTRHCHLPDTGRSRAS
jgi:hypothetical protein